MVADAGFSDTSAIGLFRQLRTLGVPLAIGSLLIAEAWGKTRIDASTAATRQSLALMAAMGLALGAGVRSLVGQGKRTAAEQRLESGRRRPLPARRASGDPEMHDPAREVAAQQAEVAEGVHRRIGADLHDGIGQLLAVALLRLDKLFGNHPSNEDYRSVRGILDDAMTEVRDLSAGLSLPHIGDLSIAEAVTSMVRRHEQRTSTEVRLTVARDLGEPDPAVKLAICRFVQEGLGNAFRHARGLGQSVEVGRAGRMIKVIVSDKGPGLSDLNPADGRLVPGSGLAGLRTRVEALGGDFSITSGTADRPGTTLRAKFPSV